MIIITLGALNKKNNNNNMRTVEECTNAGNSEIFVPSHETLLQFQFYA